MNIETDNCEPFLTEDGKVVIEPSYLSYLRSQGYIIESVDASKVIQSESSPEKGYVVLKVTTYEYPRNHPELDYAEHEMQLVICSCWAYRSDSTDVDGIKKPDGTCKHCRQAFKTKKAKEDENQSTLQ